MRVSVCQGKRLYLGLARMGAVVTASHRCERFTDQHVPAIDEGWTRWVLDHPSSLKCLFDGTLDDMTLRAGICAPGSSTVIIPDQSADSILNGYAAGKMPPEYTGGMGAAGVKALREFVEQGGTLVCLNRASSFAIEQFKLPVARRSRQSL